ncbi:glycoside hydrolase family 127 protein [Citrobacter portucalensis]|uniref:glycoside hydrolase family 127 protein n=1 Tax=Citrobacter portucalensis TaxID=1639133 RepID=UPI000FEC0FD4|nr:beta-L-arabinofuranosidase domain-containing protein [Citrobacter portucalensis]RWT89836.1 glycoside hydrolase family 127 protein [Citrobacter freundii]MDV0512903.1 glycoside hydrolase family 127 protein [Citrobacter portucalensis]MDV0518344.1 glycoside hydrolase family 127 protein [Citrobacter portucalensis]MDV0563833.1 glycoside hydrolase family 127 protein [Citrobacter portucalensis]MEB0751773.1 beta-L-arabinofuranosidase domain-containing protein [Citrobacter portucalensis]
MMQSDVIEADLNNITITDPFLGEYQRLIRDVVIPYQWQALNDEIPEAEPSHALMNYRIAAGLEHGEFYGMVFQDSDVTKWLEAVAWSLSQKPDAQLEKTTDEVIELLAKAQCEDGYLNTWYTVKEPGLRWTNVAECHEMYCAGHLFEAAVAFFNATGKRRLLEIACRFADHIDTVFGPNEGQLRGYPGHPEIELALMRLYEVTQEPRYQALARFFLEERGQQPYYYDIEFAQRGGTWHWDNWGEAWMVKDKAYTHAHKPLAQQSEAVGHAVRSVYLMTGLAHIARMTNDEEKRQTCLRIWNNMVQRRMYITGGIGSQGIGEAFTSDYDLPNDTAYGESCASIGLMMFARRMLEMEGDAHYADVMERAFYNTVLGGMALDGKHFFYVNPLETQPKSIPHNHIYDHIKPVRQRWFGCACCPPNIARTLVAIGHYIFTPRPDALFINFYAGSEAQFTVDAQTLALKIEGNYPWDEQVSIRFNQPQVVEHTLALRLPEWCAAPMVRINGEAAQGKMVKGYLHLHRQWQEGDIITLNLPMPVRRVYANPLVRHAAGKVAIQRGPLVYCLEEADNGAQLHNLSLPKASAFREVQGVGLLKGKVLLQAEGVRVLTAHEDKPLYSFDNRQTAVEKQTLTFIPWFSWANRGEGEMRIWVDEV